MGSKVLRLFLLIAILLSKEAHSEITGTCRVFDDSGSVLQTFPGIDCAFYEDGSFISLGKNSLRSFTSNGEITWEYPTGDFYHNFNLSQDRQKILLVVAVPGSSETFRIRLHILNRKGEVLHSRELPEVLKNINLQKLRMSEVPQLKKAGKIKSGSILLSGHHKGIPVFDSELKDLFLLKTVPTAQKNDLTELQITPEGTLIYLNRYAKESVPGIPVSTIEELDLSSGKVIFRYPKIPHALFFVPVEGSIQLSNSNEIIVNHPLSGLYFISRKERRLVRYTKDFHIDGLGLTPQNELRVQDLSHFIKNWKF